jgi:hypothetical protein
MNGVGLATFGAGVLIDGIGYANGTVSGAQFAENTTIGTLSFVPVAGPVVGAAYWGAETFYPGGANQAVTDLMNTVAQSGGLNPLAGF